MAADPGRRTVVVMGVSGSGKSSIGAKVAQRLHIDFVDGDDLHPPANVAKMSRGEPLTDADRWPWLDRVGAALVSGSEGGTGVVIACSALRRSYRDRIRTRAAAARPVFVFLDITVQEARRRMSRRPGHFMPVSLVESQFDTLERPASEETDVLRVEEVGGVDATVEASIEALTEPERGHSR